ncbi:hypothetical protein, partial [Sulfitobacter sp.]|uniref:hypothetical protein n=1 Tax=Sulfitobacter sp. TaxID=1903071 RepID=UPI00272C348E
MVTILRELVVEIGSINADLIHSSLKMTKANFMVIKMSKLLLVSTNSQHKVNILIRINLTNDSNQINIRAIRQMQAQTLAIK